jgi:hypothetical protein
MKNSVKIRYGENELLHWSDSISEDDTRIVYLEHSFQVKGGMEYENTLEILKKENLNISFIECLEFLKTLNKSSTKTMDKFKEFLDTKGIKYKHFLWDGWERD